MANAKLYDRRPLLSLIDVIYSAPIATSTRCKLCDCICVTSCCDQCKCRWCPCLPCLLPNLYPPLMQSAYTWVLPTHVQWNRPQMRKKTFYTCCGLCEMKPRQGCPFCCFPKMGNVFMVKDNVKVVHYDQFGAVKLNKHCLGNWCHCPMLCCGAPHIVLEDINARWPNWCQCFRNFCWFCYDDYSIDNVDADYMEATMNAIIKAKASAERAVGGSFYTPDLESFNWDDSKPTDYFQTKPDTDYPGLHFQLFSFV